MRSGFLAVTFAMGKLFPVLNRTLSATLTEAKTEGKSPPSVTLATLTEAL